MSNTVIVAEGLGKLYKIGGQQSSYRTLRDTVSEAVVSPLRRARNLLRGQAYGAAGLEESIWALKDISFDVKLGEVVGIIGHNGAGKSTLLKILSRITEPTEGYVKIHGRVGSLLEVGTGFHPELTGRENIFLNGAILGMSREEIGRKFDEIVDFAGIEKFIDTPVKYYSSGMGLRLGFAVAAHLEPEILVVDEVLAVGDAEFQKKCLGKMSEVGSEGRTVLFVSHNMQAVQSLCSRAILLQDGAIHEAGDVSSVVENYLSATERLAIAQRIGDRKDRRGGIQFRFEELEFLNPQTERPLGMVAVGQAILIRIYFTSKLPSHSGPLFVTVGFKTMTGCSLFYCRSDAIGKQFEIASKSGYFDCIIPKLPLSPGRYSYTLYARNSLSVLDHIELAGSIDVEPGDFYGTGILPATGQSAVFIDYDWNGEDLILEEV